MNLLWNMRMPNCGQENRGETHKKEDFPSFKLFNTLLDCIVNNRKLYNSTRNINKQLCMRCRT